MKLNRLHAAAMAPTPSHIKTREEKGEVRSHQRARRSSSDDNSRPKSAIPENRITTIPELAESFERRLYLRDKRAASLVSKRIIKYIKVQIVFTVFLMSLAGSIRFVLICLSLILLGIMKFLKIQEALIGALSKWTDRIMGRFELAWHVPKAHIMQ